jgi:hypothetical protein
LSIGGWDPCADGLSARSGDGDTARDTEKSNRQLPVLNRLRRRMQCALSLKHHEQSASEYGVCGNTVFDTVSRIPTRSMQSPKKPRIDRAFDHKAYNASKPW